MKFESIDSRPPNPDVFRCDWYVISSCSDRSLSLVRFFDVPDGLDLDDLSSHGLGYRTRLALRGPPHEDLFDDVRHLAELQSFLDHRDDERVALLLRGGVVPSRAVDASARRRDLSGRDIDIEGAFVVLDFLPDADV